MSQTDLLWAGRVAQVSTGGRQGGVGRRGQLPPDGELRVGHTHVDGLVAGLQAGAPPAGHQLGGSDGLAGRLGTVG